MGQSVGTLIDDARAVMLDAGWDLVLVLTDLPLRTGRRLLLTQASPVHSVGLLSVPALGPVHVRSRAVRAVPVLLGMIRANRPWRVAVGLTRALSAAAATGVAAWSPRTVAAVRSAGTGAAACAGPAVRRGGECHRDGGHRDAVFYLALFVVSLVAALLVVDAGLFGEVIARPAGVMEFDRLAWSTATLAAVGGAVGAGLETEDAVRQAAYTRGGAEASSGTERPGPAAGRQRLVVTRASAAIGRARVQAPAPRRARGRRRRGRRR